MNKRAISLDLVVLFSIAIPVALITGYFAISIYQMPAGLAERFGQQTHERQVKDFAASIEYQMRTFDILSLQQRVEELTKESPDLLYVQIKDSTGAVIVNNGAESSEIQHVTVSQISSARDGGSGPVLLGEIKVGWSNASANQLAHEESKKLIFAMLVTIVVIAIVVAFLSRAYNNVIRSISRSLTEIGRGIQPTQIKSFGIIEIEQLNDKLASAFYDQSRRDAELASMAEIHRRLLHQVAEQTLKHIRLARGLLPYAGGNTNVIQQKATQEVLRLTDSIERLADQVKLFAADQRIAGTVLYVGKNDSVSNETGRLLKLHGIQWQHTDEQHAESLYGQCTFDIVILDVQIEQIQPLAERLRKAVSGDARPSFIVSPHHSHSIDGQIPVNCFDIAAALRAAHQTKDQNREFHAM